jgi:uracil-DNA glycosylase
MGGGSPDAKILFLAEAPSYMELKVGAPLVGPSGDVFKNCLHQAGLARSQAYILNIWPYRVWKNERTGDFYVYDSRRAPEDMLWHHNKGFTELGRADAQATLQRIERSSANIIVTMGAQAMELMLGDRRPIMKWRGSVLKGFNGRKVMPTVHPAATLHGTYVWRYLIADDFKKAKRHSDSPELVLPKRTILLKPRLNEVLEYIRHCRARGKFATDLEVVYHQVHCFCMCPQPDEAMVVPLVWEGQEPYWDIDAEIEIWKAYAEAMADEKVAKVNQNLIGFDIPFLLMQNNIFTYGPIYDTMIAQHIMYPDFNKGLDFIASVHTDEPYYKDEGKMWKGTGGSLEQFWIYNGKDGCVALEAWENLAAEMTTDGYWQTYNMTARLRNPLNFMYLKGFRVDQAGLEITKARVKGAIAQKQAELNAITGIELNVQSPKQCNTYFYETKRCHVYTNKDGNPSTDDKCLTRIYRRYNLPEAKLVQEVRALMKLSGTYLEMIFDADSRMRCGWKPRGTWTGRLSSSKTIFGTGMNQQNLHPEFKEFLTADGDRNEESASNRSGIGPSRICSEEDDMEQHGERGRSGSTDRVEGSKCVASVPAS